MDDRATLIILCLGGLLPLAGLVLLHRARRADARNWFIERAPVLPLRLVHAADDVWLDGTIECDSPLTVPWFGVPCVRYHYRIEKKVTRTRRRRDGSTETYTEWVTAHSESNVTRFRLADGGESIEVRAEEAEFDDLESTGTDYESSRRRHRARYFPASGAAGVVGLVGDDRKTIGRGAHVPLVVTRRSRKEYVRAIERSESALRISGLAVLWLGLTAAGLAGALLLGWAPPARRAGELAGPALISAGAALLPLSVLWVIHAYNRLVAYRLRTENIWRLVDIDLKNRYDLIPQLVTVIKAACAHERELHRRLAELRSAYTEGDLRARVVLERRARKAVAGILALEESYPDLRTDALFTQLRDTLAALEEKIAHDRRFYDESATEYRDLVQTFPYNIVAGAGGFRPFPLFAAGEASRAPVRVDLGGTGGGREGGPGGRATRSR